MAGGEISALETSPEPVASAPPRAAPRELIVALIVGVAATAIAVLLLRPWAGSFEVPFAYESDSNLVLLTVKGITDGGWFYENDRVGAPFGLELYDHPDGGQILFAGFKVIGWLTGGEVGVTLNLNYLLGFLAIGAVAYWVLRHLEVSRPWACALGALYALLPYHFYRGVVHYYLSFYIAAPLAILLAVRQAQGPPAFVVRGEAGLRLGFDWRSSETRTALLAGTVIALTGGYYAVFAGLILLATGLVVLVAGRDRLRALSTLLVAGVIAVALAATMAPAIAYRMEYGANDQVGRRLYTESDRYALKPLFMFLPIEDHRVELLGKPMSRALEGLTSEGGQNLGAVGAAGLAALFVVGFGALAAGASRASSRIRVLSGLAIGITLAGVVGGLASVLGVLGFTVIRAWNRLSVFVGFTAVAAVGVWLSAWSKGRPRRVVWPLALALTVLGALDQSSPVAVAEAEARQVEWESDAAFVARIEAILPRGAMVYQLPYLPFPEHGPIERMADYDLVKGYLHSEDLRWSYPAMRGRVPEWQPALLSQGVPVMVEGLAAVGFEGLYIDRYGYADGAAGLEAELKALLAQEPMVSDNGRLAFFDLRPAVFELRSRLAPEEVDALAARVLLVDRWPQQ